jgi:hypothetical protein
MGSMYPMSWMKKPRRSGARFIPFGVCGQPSGAELRARPLALESIVSHSLSLGCDGHHISVQNFANGVPPCDFTLLLTVIFRQLPGVLPR